MKYKVGDKVRIKSFDWYNENKDKIDEVACGNTNFIPDMVKYCKEIVTISSVLPTLEVYHIKEDGGMFNWADEMIEGLVEEETTNVIDKGKMLIGWIKESNIYRLVPDKNYEIKYDEKGFFYLEKKKKGYPTTYEECCEILGIGSYFEPEIRNVTTEECHKFEKLIRLKRCRDAYWKIAGEKIGLGKPWEPDWEDESDKFTIGYFYNGIDTNIIRNYESHPLAFPTKEMRDAFYENFKDLIELCKELL